MSNTLYVGTYTPRGLIVKDLAKYLKLDVKIVEDKESDKKYAENFPLNKIPAFIGKNGFKLTETIAIAYYCMFSDKLKLFFISTRQYHDENLFNIIQLSLSEWVQMVITHMSITYTLRIWSCWRERKCVSFHWLPFTNRKKWFLWLVMKS